MFVKVHLLRLLQTKSSYNLILTLLRDYGSAAALYACTPPRYHITFLKSNLMARKAAL